MEDRFLQKPLWLHQHGLNAYIYNNYYWNRCDSKFEIQINVFNKTRSSESCRDYCLASGRGQSNLRGSGALPARYVMIAYDRTTRSWLLRTGSHFLKAVSFPPPPTFLPNLIISSLETRRSRNVDICGFPRTWLDRGEVGNPKISVLTLSVISFSWSIVFFSSLSYHRDYSSLFL